MSKTINNVVCPICGCLCDDLEVTIENNEIVKMKNGCAVCEAKMVHGYKSEERILKPMIRKDGKLVSVSIDEAVKKAAQILTDAKYPLLFGWSSTVGEAQRIGVELAEELGATLDNCCSVCHGPSVMATQEIGIPAATLGQIRHRADLIVYWACNPWASHPRHVERYTAFTDGRFEGSEWKNYLQKLKADSGRKKIEMASKRIARVEPPIKPQVCFTGPPPPMLEHKPGRKMIVVDVRKTMTAEVADYFLQIEPNRDYDVIEALRCLVTDQELDVDKVGGIPVDTLRDVADAMMNCEFGVIYFGLGMTQSLGRFRNIEIAIALARDLNRKTKFIISPMRGHFNVTGANTVFAWQTGYPFALDFSQGYPQFNPGENTAVDLLKRGDNDATLIISADPAAHFPSVIMQNMLKHPLITINPDMNAISRLGDVVFPTQWCGIEYSGTAYRMDAVPITLKKVVEAPPGILTDEELLIRILEEVRAIKIKRGEPVGQTEAKFTHPNTTKTPPVNTAQKKPKRATKKKVA
ncbi:MAG: formylmethanofuran dehydrogenase subunit B [Nitrososphaerota archaeon]|jgi:formylmethanofuran dehydrogenase subunit B|uniref:formylmethanofuran dehydrogenase subunit B n=1 Tax=Candidatus Bathycorpusculum sp. TaxID=2994959 RepID=UPI00283617F7|nr:formylmethanofuran dehydrogenase subunit B [Candidatus Termitimicrobium sp.]MCL2432007.1 formylmethanofuran dehydrogenase subunit B [Candidatus Termitimicrobium sp.]MDR0492910.1 formylmethanofuran dehydrogenase subunit B [Nitrososphaerota archaeon]